jgi:hypothetical protein
MNSYEAVALDIVKKRHAFRSAEEKLYLYEDDLFAHLQKYCRVRATLNEVNNCKSIDYFVQKFIAEATVEELKNKDTVLRVVRWVADSGRIYATIRAQSTCEVKITVSFPINEDDFNEDIKHFEVMIRRIRRGIEDKAR